MNAKLSEGLKKLSLDFSAGQIEQLEAYCSCVMEFNKTYNLMKADDEDELYVNHVLDSLAAAPYLSGFSAVGFRCRGIQQQGGAQQRQPDWGKAFVQSQCKTQADHCAAGTGQAVPPAAQQVRQCQRQC